MKAPITKEQVNFRRIKHAISTITINKMSLPKFSDREIVDEDGITTYPLRSNISFIKYFDDTDAHNSIEKLKKICKKLIENDHLG